MRRSDPAVRVSSPGDASEVAADRAAERVERGEAARRQTGPGVAPRGGGPLANALRPAGPGRAMDPVQRAQSERDFGTDLSGVRVHTDDRADALSRHLGADAFTVGPDVYFRRGVYDSAAPRDRHIVNHELAHVTAGSPAGGGETISRHASWEHKMLGDVDPADLEVIAAGRDLIGKKKSTPPQTITGKDGRIITPQMVLHTLEQEIERLRTFAKNPPMVGGVSEEQSRNDQDELRQLGESVEKAKKQGHTNAVLPAAKRWDVRLVTIPLKDGREAVVTYGEINTLGDFYGSTDEIKRTDPQQFLNYIYGIREESIRKFMRLHSEIAKGFGQKTKYDGGSKDNRVKDIHAESKGNTGTGDITGELKLMGKLPRSEGSGHKKKPADGREETSYTSGLARNACHFAPQSWHAWAEAHQKAVTIAKSSYDAKRQAETIQDQRKKAQTREKAQELKDAALLENGFGDHFLQDSYAGGHLINKTLVMQWFTKWLDAHPAKRDYTSDEKWAQVQNIAYGQSGIAGMDRYDMKLGKGKANDAQSVENQGGSWKDRFRGLGLVVPESLRANKNPDAAELFAWWQGQLLDKKTKVKTSNVKELTKLGPLGGDRMRTEAALKALLKDGAVQFSIFGSGDRAKIMQDKIDLVNTVGVARSVRIRSDFVPTKAIGGNRPGEQTNLNKVAKTTYGDFHTFLNHGYLQLSTNILHNYFCENGIKVVTQDGTDIGRIYGDNAMLQRESMKGVEYSATTAHMSRDSIYDLADQGYTNKSTAAIERRIPKSVQFEGQTLTLANWHADDGPLHQFCNDKIFKDTAAFFSKSTAIASDELSKKVSKDVDPGQAF